MADAAADQLKDGLALGGQPSSTSEPASSSSAVNMDGIKAPYSNRVVIKTILNAPDGGLSLVGRVITVGGWVKTGREQGKGTFAFLELNDGSCPANLQVRSLLHPLHCHHDLNKLRSTITKLDQYNLPGYRVFRPTPANPV